MCKWTIAQTERAHVVTMNSNKVNAINPAFLDDFHGALDALERLPRLPVVLAGELENGTYCAGLDLPYLFGQVGKDESAKRTRFVLDRLGEGIMRLHAFGAPTVACISGHALAGGAVIANACDFRVGYRGGNAQFGAIEVSAGVPFPAWAFAVTKSATPVAEVPNAILYGGRYSHEQAFAAGIFRSLAADKSKVLEQAVAQATVLAPSCLDAFATVKRQLVAPNVRYVAESGPAIMEEVMNYLFSGPGWSLVQSTIAGIKKK